VQYKGPNGSWLPGWARAAFWIDNSETVPVRHTFLELVVGEGAVIELDPWSVALVKPSTRELLAKTLGEDSLYMIRSPSSKTAAAQADLLSKLSLAPPEGPKTSLDVVEAAYKTMCMSLSDRFAGAGDLTRCDAAFSDAYDPVPDSVDRELTLFDVQCCWRHMFPPEARDDLFRYVLRSLEATEMDPSKTLKAFRYMLRFLLQPPESVETPSPHLWYKQRDCLVQPNSRCWSAETTDVKTLMMHTCNAACSVRRAYRKKRWRAYADQELSKYKKSGYRIHGKQLSSQDTMRRLEVLGDLVDYKHIAVDRVTNLAGTASPLFDTDSLMPDDWPYQIPGRLFDSIASIHFAMAFLGRDIHVSFEEGVSSSAKKWQGREAFDRVALHRRNFYLVKNRSPFAKQDSEFHNIPVQDMAVPSLEDLLKFDQIVSGKEERILANCGGGHGRTGTFMMSQELKKLKGYLPERVYRAGKTLVSQSYTQKALSEIERGDEFTEHGILQGYTREKNMANFLKLAPAAMNQRKDTNLPVRRDLS
jgi:hypothetical protein